MSPLSLSTLGSFPVRTNAIFPADGGAAPVCRIDPALGEATTTATTPVRTGITADLCTLPDNYNGDVGGRMPRSTVGAVVAAIGRDCAPAVFGLHVGPPLAASTFRRPRCLSW
jgi:hypothetical protein